MRASGGLAGGTLGLVGDAFTLWLQLCMLEWSASYDGCTERAGQHMPRRGAPWKASGWLAAHDSAAAAAAALNNTRAEPHPGKQLPSEDQQQLVA